MKICTKGVLGMQISKIAGNATAFQRFPPKIGNYRWPPPKHVTPDKSVQSTPIKKILVSNSMFVRSRNPIDHILNVTTYIIMT